MHHLIRAAAVAALAVPAVAFAQPSSSGPSYSYFEGGYVGTDDDLNGFGLGASLALSEMFHVEFGFSHLQDGGLDVGATTLAAGVNYPISGTTDWVASAGLARGSIDTPFGDASENGFVLRTGLRSMVTPETELNGFVAYVDTFSGETAVGVGLVRYFSDRVGLSGSLQTSDGDFGYSVGLRIGFE